MHEDRCINNEFDPRNRRGAARMARPSAPGRACHGEADGRAGFVFSPRPLSEAWPGRAAAIANADRVAGRRTRAKAHPRSKPAEAG